VKKVFQSFSKTIESPCRNCENIDMNKEECSTDCSKLHAFQDAILDFEEFSIKEFGLKSSLVEI
jgi:hypothetical protein